MNTTPTRLQRCAEAPITDRLIAIIRGDRRAFGNVDLDVVAEAQRHGLSSLIRQALVAGDAWEPIDPHAKSVLEADFHATALRDRYFRRQTIRAVTALKDAGVRSLVIKGEAIACTHYRLSHVRARLDTDLLVEKHDVAVAGEVLESVGYTRQNMVAREAVHTQQVFFETHGAIRHIIDLHWDVSHRPFFAGVLGFDELMEHSVQIQNDGTSLVAPDPVHALVLACLHRVIHHENSARLIWLYDIGLIADGLSDEEWVQLHGVAADKSLCDICASGIELASASFGDSTRTASHVAALRALGRNREARARTYLDSQRGSFGRIVLDARHTGNLPAAIRLLASHAFPDAAYMRRKYGVRNPLSLAISYVYRAARGSLGLVN